MPSLSSFPINRVLLRDSNRAFIAASCSFKEYATDVASMEAAAVLEGLCLGEELRISTLSVEYDSQIVQAFWIHQITVLQIMTLRQGNHRAL